MQVFRGPFPLVGDECVLRRLFLQGVIVLFPHPQRRPVVVAQVATKKRALPRSESGLETACESEVRHSADAGPGCSGLSGLDAGHPCARSITPDPRHGCLQQVLG